MIKRYFFYSNRPKLKGKYKLHFPIHIHAVCNTLARKTLIFWKHKFSLSKFTVLQFIMKHNFKSKSLRFNIIDLERLFPWFLFWPSPNQENVYGVGPFFSFVQGEISDKIFIKPIYMLYFINEYCIYIFFKFTCMRVTCGTTWTMN